MKNAVIQNTTVEELKRAFQNLQKLEKENSSFEKQRSQIRAFKICYEYAQKLIEMKIEEENVQVIFLSNIFIEAENIGLIKSAKIWFVFLAIKNKISCVSEKEMVEEVMEIMPVFKREILRLLNNLREEV